MEKEEIEIEAETAQETMIEIEIEIEEMIGMEDSLENQDPNQMIFATIVGELVTGNFIFFIFLLLYLG